MCACFVTTFTCARVCWLPELLLPVVFPLSLSFSLYTHTNCYTCSHTSFLPANQHTRSIDSLALHLIQFSLSISSYANTHTQTPQIVCRPIGIQKCQVKSNQLGALLSVFLLCVCVFTFTFTFTFTFANELSMELICALARSLDRIELLSKQTSCVCVCVVSLATCQRVVTWIFFTCALYL